MSSNTRLAELYGRTGKHSQYQACDILSSEGIKTRSHYERERLEFLLENLDVRGKTILDIGGNTGWFSLELLSLGAKYVTFYEGNKDHAEFVREAADIAGFSGKIEIHPEYYDFSGKDSDSRYDIVLLLNVLHHVGDDYGGNVSGIDAAKRKIIEQLLVDVSGITEYVFFQLGFNWQGNIKQPLFADGTKAEMIAFIQDRIKDCCEVVSTGIAERTSDGSIRYAPVNQENIKRDDSLGEFLNRPLFILRRKLPA